MLLLGACRLHPRVAASLPGFCAQLSRSLGEPVAADTRQSYQELLGALLDEGERLALAWLPPVLVARALAAGGTLLATPERAGSGSYRSALLVSRESGLAELPQLRGKRAAWVDRASASGYLFPRAELLQQPGFEGFPAAPRPFASEMFHGATVRAAAAVVAGEADFCACFVTSAAARDPRVAEQDLSRALGPLANKLRPLHVGALIPPDGLVAAPRTPPALRDRLAASLLALHLDAEGARALEALLQAARLVPPGRELLGELSRFRALDESALADDSPVREPSRPPRA